MLASARPFPDHDVRLSLALLLCCVPLLAGAPAAGGSDGVAAAAIVRVLPQHSGVDVRLRGISAVDGAVAWASGANGTVLRTLDGGAHWQRIPVPGADALDFRDIEGFDAMTAVVLAIGPGAASRVYRTGDGGRHGGLRCRTAIRAPSSTAWRSRAGAAGSWAIRWTRGSRCTRAATAAAAG